jgi:hypothetical protein
MRKLALATLFFFTAALAMPAITSAQARPGGLTVPVTGAGRGAVFNGTLQIQRFVNNQGQLVANGILTGVLTNATGQSTSVVQTVALPAAVTQATCEILHLDLGPLNLNILGLQIDLSRIVLDITAQSGAGNLLGNLLCGIAGLLDSPGGLARLLNQILAILG